jgi:hypothetical protein
LLGPERLAGELQRVCAAHEGRGADEFNDDDTYEMLLHEALETKVSIYIYIYKSRSRCCCMWSWRPRCCWGISAARAEQSAPEPLPSLSYA